MKTVGVRELRQRASAILREVEAGETFEITDRGRPSALLTAPVRQGLARLEREGLIRPAQGDLLDLKPIPLPRGKRRPSDLVSEGRDED